MEVDSGLTLYDINKQIISQEKPLDVIALHIKVKDMIHDIYERKIPYWMLLCKERNDYTVFIPLTEDGTFNDMLETLNNRGQVLDIDKQEDNNYEIWIRDTETQENFVYYFFDYQFGVVKS